MFSDPVVGNKFFGRAAVLALLAKRVKALQEGYRQNIAIVGPELIGKSSLILHFFSNFSNPKIVPIYIDLRANSFNHFIYKFIGSLLYQFLKNRNVKVSEELEFIKRSAKDLIPETATIISEIEEYVKQLQYAQAFEKLLSLTTVFSEETKTPCIVILDEFHLLESYKLKGPFAILAKEIMLQKNTMYILLSSQVSYAKKILANEISLLFGNFEIIHLGPFDYATCCDFLIRRLKDIYLSKSLKDFIICLCKGHPFYLDILSNKLQEKANQLNRKEITRNITGEVLNSLIYDSKGILNQYFTNLLSRSLNGADYSSFLPILSSVSEKGSRLHDISRIANGTRKIVSRQISQLLDKDLLTKTGVFYSIEDRLLRCWLSSVYRQKSLSLTANPATESQQFSKAIEDQIMVFTQETKKQVDQRIIELFQCFRNEKIMLQSKMFKFWHFADVRPWTQFNIADCILARYQDGYWASLVKSEKISESQIQNFVKCCRSSEYNIRRLLLITFKELDLNAKLIALEKKVWIWHLRDLNMLLDLYGREQFAE